MVRRNWIGHHLQERPDHQSSGNEDASATETLRSHFQAVIVLGKNWRRYPPKAAAKDWRLHLSIESKMSALAAGEMYISELVDTIIFSTGKSAGTKWPSEARAMSEFMKQRYTMIPDDAVILEESSIDTMGNAEEVLKILRVRGFKKVALLTVGFHLPRAQYIFNSAGIAAVGFVSEQLLWKRSAHYKAFTDEFLSSSRVAVEMVKEVVLRGILVVDSRGRALREMTKRIRG